MGIAFLHLPEMGDLEGKNKDAQKFLYREKLYFLGGFLKMRNGNKVVSKISDEQQEILERFHINLEGG